MIQNGGQMFRFISAAPQTNTSLDAVSRHIANSFRSLSKREIAALRPLSIKLVAYNGGSINPVIRQMKGTDNPRALFKLLNGLSGEDLPEPGTRVKIVSD